MVVYCTYHKLDIQVEHAELMAALKGSGCETYKGVFAFLGEKHQKCMKAPRNSHMNHSNYVNFSIG